MKVLMVEPFVSPYIKEIDNSLKAMQKAVDGYIEPAYFYNDVVLIVNDEGKINGSFPNRVIKNEDGKTIDIIYGSFFICEEGEESFKSISNEKARKYMEIFSSIKQKEQSKNMEELSR